MTPGLTCATCAGSLYPKYARADEDGYHHAQRCPSRRPLKACEQCGQVGRRAGDFCQGCIGASPAVLPDDAWKRRGLIWVVAS